MACHTNSSDEASHILFECNNLSNERDALWQKVTDCMSPNMINDISRMHSSEKARYILSCYNDSYVAEWSVLYTRSIYFVHKMYQFRAEKYDNMTQL